MKYIWEVVTKDKLGGAALSDVSFVPARKFSPYMEVNFDSINEIRVGSDLRVEVNPFVRFNGIFGNLMRPEFTEFTEYRDTMFDMLMHLLLATDKKSGHDRRSIRRFSIARNIQNGGFGLDVKNDFAALSDFERDTIADGLIALRESGFSFHLYGEICKRIFPNMILYLKIREEKALLVYHGEPETPRREAVARLCREFLLPADLKTDFYWDRHFGIFDIPETIRLDETVFV